MKIKQNLTKSVLWTKTLSKHNQKLFWAQIEWQENSSMVWAQMEWQENSSMVWFVFILLCTLSKRNWHSLCYLEVYSLFLSSLFPSHLSPFPLFSPLNHNHLIHRYNMVGKEVNRYLLGAEDTQCIDLSIYINSFVYCNILQAAHSQTEDFYVTHSFEFFQCLNSFYAHTSRRRQEGRTNVMVIVPCDIPMNL